MIIKKKWSRYSPSVLIKNLIPDIKSLFKSSFDLTDMGNSRTGLNGQKISDSGESLCEKFLRECIFKFPLSVGVMQIDLKFEGDHRINESNVSQAFHENMIIWMYFWQARDKSKYWYKICYQVGFWWNFQETFLSSMLWICPNFKKIPYYIGKYTIYAFTKKFDLWKRGTFSIPINFSISIN